MKLLPLLAFFLPLGFLGSLLAAPGITIYNQNFAVVRDTIPLDLKKGINEVTFDRATLHLEPDSVILRDPAGGPLQVLEQNYRNDPVTQTLLLSLFEGKEIDFFLHEVNKPDRIIKGKIIRSGYVPLMPSRSYGMAVNTTQQPIIEVDGKIQFTLPGEPIFPSLGDETILKPQLNWKINAPKSLKMDAEIGYITSGMSWEASYNILLPEKGDVLDLVGWVTMDNQSGADFKDAKINLMAGDVNKIVSPEFRRFAVASTMAAQAIPERNVTEKTFDEYHLYTLEHPTTLRDMEKKQVEFIRATGVNSEVNYIYDGVAIDWNQWGGMNNLRLEEDLGVNCNKKVVVMREFKNTKENGLGIPLPKGRLRFYRSNGSQLEFIGENIIDHTPTDETIRINTGNAFDLVGERKRMNFHVDHANHWAEESIEITLRNHKKETATIRVVEHLFRGNNWEITKTNIPFHKVDADKIEFRVTLKPDEEKKVAYTVHYSW